MKLSIKLINSLVAIALIAIIVFSIGFITVRQNADLVSDIHERIYPITRSYNQVKVMVLKIQYWLTNISTTRSKKKYDSGFKEAEKYYLNAKKTINELLIKYKENRKLVKDLTIIEKRLNNYYNVAIDVAKTYFERGPYYGNAMQDVLSNTSNVLIKILDEEISNYHVILDDNITEIDSKSSFIKIFFFISAVIIIILTVILIFSGNLIGQVTNQSKELQKIKSYLDNVINSMPSILIGLDHEGNITSMNYEAEQRTGIKINQALGKSLSKVFPHYEKYLGEINDAIKTKKYFFKEKIPIKTSGVESQRIVNVTGYPLITNGIEGAVIIENDVTERIRIQELLIQSEKMLSLGGLAAGMAHEINNPLTGILMNIQVLQKKLSNSSEKNEIIAEECNTNINNINSYLSKQGIPEIIKYIHESGVQATKVVQNTLNFSRKSDLQFEKCMMDELIDKTLELFKSNYDLKKKFDIKAIEIVRQYDDNLPKINCDKIKIQQVLLNILKNGAEAVFENIQAGKTMQFILRLTIENKMLKLEIGDNGPGIPEEISKRIFEPFFTTKKLDHGSGLGLSVSYFIITKNHKGEMAVESEPGRGTTFIIKLPYN